MSLDAINQEHSIPRLLGIVVSGFASDSAEALTDKKAMLDRQDDGLEEDCRGRGRRSLAKTD
jgi:hypothetical protein